MAAKQMLCWKCGTSFYGRADARYCGGPCRQKAYRERTYRRAVMEAVPAVRLGDEITRARQGRQRARTARKRAAAARRVSAEVMQKIGRNI